MNDEEEQTGRCGWAALALVLILLSGILPGGLYAGLAGPWFAEHAGLDHAWELGERLFVLSGLVAGLLVSALTLMTATIIIVGAAGRYRSRPSLGERSSQELRACAIREEEEPVCTVPFMVK